MSRSVCILLAAGLGLIAPGAVFGQGVWVPHQPPCDLNTSHYLVKGGVVDLKLSVESHFPDEHDKRLEDARTVLTQAIVEKGQADNPAAWYYLGRMYTAAVDLEGADSAFRRAVELAPACAEDVAQYRSKLGALGLNDALRTWGAGDRDSALIFFRRARSLDSTDAEIPLYTSIMFASATEPDSAAKYLELGLAAARTDTSHSARLKQAQVEVARAFESRAYNDVPAIQTVSQTRLMRDSTVVRIAADSVLFDKIVTQVSDIRNRGQHLNAQSLAAFQRDSTTLAVRLAAARHAIDSLRPKAAKDSAAVATALAPVVRYYQRYTEAYPEDADAAIQLVRLYSALGDRPALEALVAKVAESPHSSGPKLTQAGLSLYNDGLTASAAIMLEAALRRDPNDHAALGIITHVYHTQGRGDTLLRIARRRMALEPLEPAAARAVALAWDVKGNDDSTKRWLAVADTGLAWNVHVTQFSGGEQATVLNGYVNSSVPRSLPASDLVFEFLDATGNVLFDTTVTLPELAPHGRSPFTLRLDKTGAISWRYRRPP